MQGKKLSLSIVSHGHKQHVGSLMADLIRLGRADLEVILTLNVPEELMFDKDTLPFALTLVKNVVPKGFAANHNAAFSVSTGENFVVLNPDIQLLDDPFPPLLALLEENPHCICAPFIVNQSGAIEDSARYFPTPTFLLKKLLGKLFQMTPQTEEIPASGDVLMPDWVAGMFIVIPRAIYIALEGLNERYHMYYEDVDFCARARLAGYEVLVSKRAKVVHEAQRDSHRKVRYLMWHIGSALRFFCSSAYRRMRPGYSSRS